MPRGIVIGSVTNRLGNFILIWRVSSLFPESRARLSRQTRNRFLPSRSFGRILNIPLCSDSLFSSCHKFRNEIYPGRIFRALRVTLRLSGDAFACALLSSRQTNAIMQSVASPPVSRVSTMPALMRNAGSRVQARVSLRESVFEKAFCDARRGPL